MNQQEFKNVLIKLEGAIMHVPLFAIFLKKLKRFSHQLNYKNNGPVSFVKTVSQALKLFLVVCCKRS